MPNSVLQEALIPAEKIPAAEGWLEAWKCSRPLAGPAKDSPKWPMSRDRALTMASIEVNPPCLKSLVVVDIDTSDVEDLALAVGLPRESWAVRTHNETGTGHIGYALASPVCVTDAAHRRPINLLCRIETGLTDVLGGDVAYTGTFTKNPIMASPLQDTLWPEMNDVVGWDYPRYELKQLASALDKLGALPAYNDPRPRQNAGIGRNVDVFDRTRRWAYRAVRRYWGEAFDLWALIVEDHATITNEALEREHRDPLPTNEIHHLARSIAKWVWTRFTPDQFAHVQTNRGRKGGLAYGQKRRAGLELLNG